MIIYRNLHHCQVTLNRGKEESILRFKTSMSLQLYTSWYVYRHIDTLFTDNVGSANTKRESFSTSGCNTL